MEEEKRRKELEDEFFEEHFDNDEDFSSEGLEKIEEDIILDDTSINVAIIGRVNVGKSSILNALFGIITGKKCVLSKKVNQSRKVGFSGESKMQILTSKGFRDFDGFVCNGLRPVGDLSFNGKTLTCTPDHRLLINGEWVEASNIEGYSVNREEVVYDAINVDDGSEYLTNGISSHNCLLLDEFAFVPNNIADEFFASVYPTIASGKDSKLAMVSTPNGLNHFHQYQVTLKARRYLILIVLCM